MFDFETIFDFRQMLIYLINSMVNFISADFANIFTSKPPTWRGQISKMADPIAKCFGDTGGCALTTGHISNPSVNLNIDPRKFSLHFWRDLDELFWRKLISKIFRFSRFMKIYFKEFGISRIINLACLFNNNFNPPWFLRLTKLIT